MMDEVQAKMSAHSALRTERDKSLGRRPLNTQANTTNGPSTALGWLETRRSDCGDRLLEFARSKVCGGCETLPRCNRLLFLLTRTSVVT